MMGAAVGRQDRLFYQFNLEDMVPVIICYVGSCCF